LLKSTKKNTRNSAVQFEFSSFFTRGWSGWKYELAGFLLFAFAWAAVTQIVFTRPELYHFKGFLPGPTLAALADAFQNSKFWMSVFASLRRIVLGIAISAFIGLPLGVLIGFFTRLRKLTYSPIQFVRMISPLSWMPIALLLFTSFESVKWKRWNIQAVNLTPVSAKVRILSFCLSLSLKPLYLVGVKDSDDF